jgi:homoserine trans-succinylase
LVTVNRKKNLLRKLTYAANWDDFDKVPFWNELDYIGIDAYFPLSDATTHRCWNLDAWQQHIKKIEKLQAKTKKNTLYRVWLTATQIRQQRNLGRKRKHD